MFLKKPNAAKHKVCSPFQSYSIHVMHCTHFPPRQFIPSLLCSLGKSVAKAIGIPGRCNWRGGNSADLTRDVNISPYSCVVWVVAPHARTHTHTHIHTFTHTPPTCIHTHTHTDRHTHTCTHAHIHTLSFFLFYLLFQHINMLHSLVTVVDLFVGTVDDTADVLSL